MFKKLMIGGMIILNLVGCAKSDSEMVTEHFEITMRNKNEVYGEKIEGTGEGIFYFISQFEYLGIEDIEVGDVIKISWTEENFQNENWEEFEAEKVD